MRTLEFEIANGRWEPPWAHSAHLLVLAELHHLLDCFAVFLETFEAIHCVSHQGGVRHGLANEGGPLSIQDGCHLLIGNLETFVGSHIRC